MGLKKICIVQARLGSRRLPGKVIKIINGKPMIYWLILRLIRTKIFDIIVVAIPSSKNSKLLNYLKSISSQTKIKIFQGSEKNVLERYYYAAKKFKADIITRATADDPLKDISVIRSSLLRFIKLKLDYYSNTIRQTFPIGIDIEHFTFKTLKLAYKLADTDYEKEHVTALIKQRPDKFKIKNFTIRHNLTKYRLTVDNIKDFERIKKIFIFFKNNPYISYKKIIQFLNKKNEKNHK
jgi:spore coat polysaccharide biosynthesis protein SpsF